LHAVAHILEQLVERGHEVVTTVRSEDKAQPIRDAYKGRGKVEVVIVPDSAQEDAFDEVVKTPGLEAVLHTASPFHYQSSESSKPWRRDEVNLSRRDRCFVSVAHENDCR
jgi:nucleoside-diphosphate-sugar epimerase